MRNTFAARTDDNQQDVVEDLRRAGWHVEYLFRMGSGRPDIEITPTAYASRKADRDLDRIPIKIEIKDGLKHESARRLTNLEVKFFRDYPGPVFIAHTGAEALRKARVFLSFTPERRRTEIEERQERFRVYFARVSGRTIPFEFA